MDFDFGAGLLHRLTSYNPNREWDVRADDPRLRHDLPQNDPKRLPPPIKEYEADLPVKFSARFHSTDQVHVKPAQVERVLAPHASETIEVRFELPAPILVSEMSLLAADWSLIYEFPKVPPVEITGKHVW